jgi:hypothetical protein
MIEEQDGQLETEAAGFFAAAQPENRTGTLDFQEAALRTFDRDWLAVPLPACPPFPA